MQILMDLETRHELAVYIGIGLMLFFWGNMALVFIDVIRFYHTKKKRS